MTGDTIAAAVNSPATGATEDAPNEVTMSHRLACSVRRIMTGKDWWRQACVYQIYPRSFADANGDGIGDLKGIVSRADYLKDLGVDAVWLCPFYPSALRDGGYDVADYRNVDPRIGTLDDFDEMVAALKAVNIKVIVDIVPNHASEDHEWFQAALKAGKGSKERERFIFRDGPNKDQPPSDWQSNFGGPAWTKVDDQWYLHMFDSSQPDWNWSNPEVREDFLTTVRFWADRGIAGFRVDVAPFLTKDMSEPQMPWAQATKLAIDMRQRGADRSIEHPFFDRDDVLDVYRSWRKIFNQYNPPLTAVGELYVAPDRKHLYTSPETLGQVFDFDIVFKNFNAPAYRACIDTQIAGMIETGSTTTWVLSNHDVFRHASRLGLPDFSDEDAEDPDAKLRPWLEKEFFDKKSCDAELGLRKAKAATMLLLALPGSMYLYQGEELGLPEVRDIPDNERTDPFFDRGICKGRDGCRVPLPWTAEGPSHGFNATGETHLPMPPYWGDFAADQQADDAESTLSLYRRALRLRRELRTANTMEWVASSEDVLHFQRPGGWHVMSNFGDTPVQPPSGQLVLTSGPLEDGKVPRYTTVWVKA